MGYGASGDRGEVPADECEPRVSERAGHITNESRRMHETKTNHFKKPIVKIESKKRRIRNIVSE